jgi:mRNA-degrading endonuclease RelE of RelBE toxin-antitoxin system
MAIRIAYRATARSQFQALDNGMQRAFADALGQVARDPQHPPYWLDVEPIRGMKNGWRLALKGYRATYRVERTKLVVLDLELGHEIYRKWGAPDV